MTDVSATFATFPGPGGVVGRAAELSVLGHLVDDVVAGRGGAVLVEGEPGIGKSTVLRVAMSRAATRGCQVFWCTAARMPDVKPTTNARRMARPPSCMLVGQAREINWMTVSVGLWKEIPKSPCRALPM